MTPKENIVRTLQGGATGRMPVTPHWWGLYKFELAGLIGDYNQETLAWSLAGRELANIDARFHETFRPDMFHLTTGASRTVQSEAVRQEKTRLVEAVARLESRAVIDEFVSSHYSSKAEVLASGVFDHIRLLSERYGSEHLLMLNEGNPICWLLDPHGVLGFEGGLVSLMENPDRVEYLLHACYEAMLPRMEALKEAGGDGYIGSETYCSADIMSPDLYRRMIFPAQKRFYTAVRDMGLIPVTYFTGEVNPLLDDIAELGVAALMVEEGKKGFTLDIGEIYDKLDGRIGLFGNLDSVYTLRMGSREDVVRETKRQIQACNRGGFVMANGSPVCFRTPLENIRAMIETVRGA